MRTLTAIAFVAVAAFATAQIKSVKMSASGQPRAKAGKVAIVSVKLDIPNGYHIYGPKDKSGIPTDVKFSGPKGFTGKVNYPKTSVFQGVEGPSEVYFSSVTIPVAVSIPKTAKGKQTFTLKVTAQACNDRTCLPPVTNDLTVTTVVK